MTLPLALCVRRCFLLSQRITWIIKCDWFSFNIDEIIKSSCGASVGRCGLHARRPNLGARAFAAGWYFDFSLAYVGAGFITPLSVNYSMMVGAVVSSGIAWPLLRNRAGDWFPAGLGLYNFQGEFAYHVSACPPPPPV